MLVTVVSDGRSKVNDDTLKYLGSLGIYDKELMDSALLTTQEIPTMHLFEKTLQMGIDDGANYAPSHGVDNGKTEFRS